MLPIIAPDDTGSGYRPDSASYVLCNNHHRRGQLSICVNPVWL
jgi:hypothetical protein